MCWLVIRDHARFVLVGGAWLAAVFAVSAADRYAPAGPSMWSGEVSESSGWEPRPGKFGAASAEGGAAVLSLAACPEAHRCSASWARELPHVHPGPRVRLSADIEVDALRLAPGDPGVGLYLSSGGEGVARWHIALRPLPSPLPEGRHRVEQVFDTEGVSGPWTLHLALGAHEGRVRVRDLALEPVQDQPWRRAGAIGLSALGALALLGLLAPSVRAARRSLNHAAVLAAAGAIVLGTLSGRAWTQPVRAQATLVRRALVPAPAPTVAEGPGALEGAVAAASVWFDKVAHLVAFAVFAALARRAWGDSERARLGWAVLALAVGTEALQALTEDRGARLTDVGIDLLGAGLGLWVLGLARRR